MPSQNKTKFYNLNQWQGTEYPQRMDFNEDNLKIDAALKGISDCKLDLLGGNISGNLNVEKINNRFIQKDENDRTPKSLMGVGAFGLGACDVSDANMSPDSIHHTSIFRYNINDATLYNLPDKNSGILFTKGYSGGEKGNTVQEYTSIVGSEINLFIRHRDLGKWGPWQKIATDGKFNSALTFYGNSGVRSYKNVLEYYNSSSSISGILKISLPKSWTNTMMRGKIQGYDYSGKIWEMDFSGYNYADAALWYQGMVSISGEPPFESVKYGHDGSKCCILLGTSSTKWTYTNFIITDFQAAYSQIENWEKGWEANVISSENGISKLTVPTMYRPVPETRRINGKSLTSDVTLSAIDVGAFTHSNYGNVLPVISTHISLNKGHENTVLILRSASQLNVSIPLDSKVNFTVGTSITLLNHGTGEVDIVSESGVTLYSKDNLKKMDGLFSSVTLIKIASNQWHLIGAIK